MPKNRKLAQILLVLSSLLLSAGFLIFILEKVGLINIYSYTDNQSNGPSAQQKAQDEKVNSDSKQRFLDNTYGNDDKYTSTANKPSIQITAKQEGLNVLVLTKIQNLSDGGCTLTISSNGKIISEKASVIFQPEFSSCAGFSIPISKLGNGSWIIAVEVIKPDGSAVSQSTTLGVN